MAYLAQFVEAARKELLILWDKCYYGKAQRNAFAQIHSTDFNEQVLDEHESEVEKLKSFLERNSELFAKVKLVIVFGHGCIHFYVKLWRQAHS